LQDNSFTQAIVDGVVNGFNAYWTEVETNVPEAHLVVVSRVQNKVTLSQGLTYRVNAVIVTDNYVDSQRRRLTGRGT
jgi:hypothetical protein